MVWSFNLKDFKDSLIFYTQNCTEIDAEVSLAEITQITDVESDQKVKQLLNQLTSILFHFSQCFMVHINYQPYHYKC